jgi:hypothetical protein
MADFALDLAARHGSERVLLRHALGSPPLARLLLPRLAAAAPGLLRPPARAAAEITHVLVESADSEGALEAATLLLSLTSPGAAGSYPEADRRELLRLLSERRPASLLEWYWLEGALSGIGPEEGGPLRAQPLLVSDQYWGVMQVCWAGGRADGGVW